MAQHSRRLRRAIIPMVVALATAATFVGPVHGQDASSDAADKFLVTLAEARDAAQARIDDTQNAGERACVGLAGEACLQQVAADDISSVAEELESYIDVLEGSAPPEIHADDVAAQILALRAAIENLAHIRAGAIAGDFTAVGDAATVSFSIYADLAASLGPEYAAAAFIHDFGNEVDFLTGALDLTADDRAYLAAVRDAPRAAASNFDCFSRTINEVYGDPESLLAALSECGAGEAVAKIETALREIEPSERFIDEHAWWLAANAEAVRYDQHIGTAVVDGDVTAFLVHNARMGLAQKPVPGLDPIFVRDALQIRSRALDPTEPLARTIYGRELHAALTAYQVLDPTSVFVNTIQFPQIPRETALAAITELAPEVLAMDAALFSALERLVPPPELADDHATILRFFTETHTGSLESLVEAAANDDVAATFVIENESLAAYCEASTALSAQITPAAEAFFDANAPFC